MKEAEQLERALVLETVRITKQVAISASRLAGKGDSIIVDQASSDAMLQVLNALDVDGKMAIGEGQMDEAPVCFISEKE